MKHCSIELGRQLQDNGVNLNVMYVYSKAKQTVLYNNGNLFSPMAGDVPLLTEPQLNRLLPNYLKVNFKNGGYVVYNEKTKKSLDFTMSDNIIDAKARALLIYLQIEPTALERINKNNVEIIEIIERGENMILTISGIHAFSTSEIREIVENAFANEYPDINAR